MTLEDISKAVESLNDRIYNIIGETQVDEFNEISLELRTNCIEQIVTFCGIEIWNTMNGDLLEGNMEIESHLKNRVQYVLNHMQLLKEKW